MCGISGVISTNKYHLELQRAVYGMLDTIDYRGPDERKVVSSPGFAVGAVRLSIVGLSMGHQPIQFDNNVVSMNGEIYNYKDFAQLNTEIDIHSCSDLEVAAKLYSLYGISFIEKIQGMYALSILDKTARCLYLIRDRCGEKPLYYYIGKDKQLIYGSEVKSILSALNQHPTVNTSQIAHFLARGCVQGPSSIYEGIFQVPPGCFLRYKLDDHTLNIKRYWSWPEPSHEECRDEKPSLDDIRNQLNSSIALCLTSDVPVASMLSGGLDSSYVTSVAARQLNKLSTFTFCSRDAIFDESNAARFLANYFGTDHYEVEIPPLTESFITEVAHCYDEPFADSSSIPTYLVSKEISKQFKVCLTGDGGDEVFLGYPLYSEALRRSQSRLLNSSIFSLPRHVVDHYYPTFLRGKTRAWTTLAKPTDWFHWRRSFFPHYINPCNDLSISDQYNAAHLSLASSPNLNGSCLATVAEVIRHDRNYYLVDDLLVKTDRASMANSVEMRTPFLNHHLIELSARLPISDHLDTSHLKKFYKQIIREAIPLEVLNLPKKGFSIPIRDIVTLNLDGWLGRILLHSPNIVRHGWISRQHIQKLVALHSSGRRDFSKPLWSLLQLEFWCQKYYPA